MVKLVFFKESLKFTKTTIKTKWNKNKLKYTCYEHRTTQKIIARNLGRLRIVQVVSLDQLCKNHDQNMVRRCIFQRWISSMVRYSHGWYDIQSKTNMYNVSQQSTSSKTCTIFRVSIHSFALTPSGVFSLQKNSSSLLSQHTTYH